jgi:hypothetical protein
VPAATPSWSPWQYPSHWGLRKPFTTFEAPGVGHGATPGAPIALCIDPSGTIIGFRRDANDVRHGFIRPVPGTAVFITIFRTRPGAGTRQPARGHGPTPTNPSGTIYGILQWTQSKTAHGTYVRLQSKVCLLFFDAPGAGHGTRSGQPFL